jgi:hypothetical protein
MEEGFFFDRVNVVTGYLPINQRIIFAVLIFANTAEPPFLISELTEARAEATFYFPIREAIIISGFNPRQASSCPGLCGQKSLLACSQRIGS